MVERVAHKPGRKTAADRVLCGEGCGRVASMTGGAFDRAGRCQKCANLSNRGGALCAVDGCVRLAEHGSGDGFRCHACDVAERKAVRRAELDGALCSVDGCGRVACASAAAGVVLCEKHLREMRNGGERCGFDGCEEPQRAIGLCTGHAGQDQKGDALTPLYSTHHQREYDGRALYLLRVEFGGELFDVFGITVRDVDIRFRDYWRGGVDVVRRVWFRWPDAQVAVGLERELKRLAVRDDSLPVGMQGESWPADDAKVSEALALIGRRVAGFAFVEELGAADAALWRKADKEAYYLGLREPRP